MYTQALRLPCWLWAERWPRNEQIRSHLEEQMPSPAVSWQWFLLRGKENNTAGMYSPSRQHRHDCKQDSPSNDPLHTSTATANTAQQSKAKQSARVVASAIYQGSLWHSSIQDGTCSQAWGSDSTLGFVIKCFRVCVHIPKQYKAYHFNFHLPKTIGRWKEIRQNPVRESADIIKAQKKTCSEFPL